MSIGIKPLPLTVIGGFLGAGKTTLLNRWLREAGGQRLAVLVNDFGALNIDAELIAASGGEAGALIELSNGCVCCQIGDDLSGALIRVLDSAATFDAVVIEASGVSDPWRIAQLGRADPGLNLDGIVVLVDASAVLAQSRDPLLADTLARQLRSAGLLVLNKADLVDADELRRCRAWIASIVATTPVIETSNAEVPLALLSGHALAAHAGMTVHDHDHDHDHDHQRNHDDDHTDPAHDPPRHGAIFETWSARPARTFDEATLRAWLAVPPAGLLRLKGIVRIGGSGAAPTRWCEVQFAGRFGGLRSAASPRSGAALVAIGLRGQLPIGALDILSRAG